MSLQSQLDQVLADMQGAADETRKAIATATQLARQMPPNDDHSRVMEQLTLGEQRLNLLRSWIDSLAAIRAAVGGEAVAWHTEDHLTDKSATTYDRTVAGRWINKGWPVTPLYASPPATVDVGVLRKLAEKWRLYAGDNELCALEADSIGLNESAKSHDNLAKALDKCADELAALIDGAGNG